MQLYVTNTGIFNKEFKNVASVQYKFTVNVIGTVCKDMDRLAKAAKKHGPADNTSATTTLAIKEDK